MFYLARDVERIQTVFKLAVHNLQFAKHFGSLQMNFCIFSKDFEWLKSDSL